MALRDYLNFESINDMHDYVLQNGQAVAIVTMDQENPVALETWYYNASSLLEENGINVMKPDEIPDEEPGRYIKNITSSEWDFTLNKPVFADVAMTGSYNDLEDKLTAGEGIIMNSNELSVDDNIFMTVATATSAIENMEAEIATKAPEVRTVTINGITQTLEANRDWEVGNVSTTGNYANPSWINSLAYSKITGAPLQMNSDWLSNSGASQILNKPDLSLYYLASNPNAYISNVPAQSWASITGKPSFSTVSTTGNYNDLSNKPTIPTNNNQLTNGASYITAGQVITSLGITPVDITGARNAISLTTTGTSGNATYVPSTGVLNIPNYTSTSKSFNNAAVKTINGAGVQISTTRDAFVTYTVTHTIALTLLLASGSSQVFLEVSPNNSTWTTISQAGYSDAVAVAVALTKTTTNNVQGMIPAGNYVRLRSVVSGGGSTTFTNGQEVLN